MFISKLIHTVEQYDPYGMHRLNGAKAVYVLFILFTINVYTDIPSVYFYFFYTPMTALTTEITGDSVENKFKLFQATMLGTIMMTFLFNLFNPYPWFFVIFGFLSTFGLYSYALRSRHDILPLIPIMLSLAAYSTSYPNLNANIDLVINNAFTTFFAIIILAALLFFPLSYNYRAWLRAFSLLLQEIVENLISITQQKCIERPVIQGHTRALVLFARMLPRHLPTRSILKINLLIHELNMMSAVTESEFTRMSHDTLKQFIADWQLMQHAVSQERMCPPHSCMHPKLYQLIRTWNMICRKH